VLPRLWFCGCAAAGLLATVAVGAQAEAAPPLAPAPFVQPSAGHVPANLLRISIRFAAPVDGGVLPRLALLRPDGSAIAAPFLQQELWSPDGTVLTLLLHPGRVKTGLNAREALGPILEAGEAVSLTLDGRTLRRWQVDPADTEGPLVAAWQLAPVSAGSRQALAVTLDAAVDGRAADYVAIADARGRRVEGKAVLVEGESRWIFRPAHPWRRGQYRIVVRGTLEDAAGNRVNGRFETPRGVEAPAAAQAAATDVVRPFSVR
jgi:hypothetical protein